MEKQKQIEKIKQASSFNLSSSSSKNIKMALNEAEQFAKLEKERHDRLIGQLKAAEATNR